MNMQHFSAADARLRSVHSCALLQSNAHLTLIKISSLETYTYSEEINKILLQLGFCIDYSLCVCYFSLFPYFPYLNRLSCFRIYYLLRIFPTFMLLCLFPFLTSLFISTPSIFHVYLYL